MSRPLDEARLRALVEHTLDVIALVEPDGTVSYVSPSIVRVLGYTPDEFVAIPPFEIVHPDDRDEAARRLRELAAQPGSVHTVVNRVRHKDGSWRWIETVSSNQREDAALQGIVAAFRDVSARRRAEDALREREDYFRLIVESAVDFALFTLDLDGRIVSWNSGAERILGYTEEEVIGQNVRLLFTPEDNARGRAEREMRGAAVAGHDNDDRWHIKKGGIRFWANGMMMPLKAADGTLKGYVKILRDRTEQKLARDALRRSEERLRLAVDAARLGLWHAEVPLDRMNWDERCKEHFGLPPDAEVTVETFYERLHPDDRQRTREAIERALHAREPYDIEYRTVAPDGRVRWVRAIGRASDDESDRASRFDGVTIDVTDRRRADEALRESEARFRSMADSAPVMIWLADTAGRRQYFNKPWRDFTGSPSQEGLAEAWPELVHPDDRQPGLSRVQAALEERQPFDIEFRLRRADGEYRWIFSRATPLLGPNGEFTGYIGSDIDITDRKLAEEALKDADRRKDEFLAMLAHELRNPLAAINNAVQVSLRAGRVEDLEWSKEVIGRQARHLARLIDDLLDVSRITRGKIQLRKERIDLGPIITRAVDSVRPLMEQKGHTLTLSITPGRMRLLADPTRIEQVLVNLLANAAKYTDDGGRIRLTAEHNEHLVVTVTDNGIGIPADTLPHVFDLFAQAERSIDRSQGGLGIGLTLVRKLVELHGGTVTAASAGLGQGSTFTVTLPTADTAVADEPVPVEPAATVRTPDGLRVLVVDDNRDTAAGMSRLLRASGYQVTTAHDGPAALATARAERPDVVLMDIGLPGMDGYAVASSLREDERCRGAVLIAVSGYGQERDRRRSREAGFDHHLVKPVDYDSLLALLARQRSVFPFAPGELAG